MKTSLGALILLFCVPAFASEHQYIIRVTAQTGGESDPEMKTDQIFKFHENGTNEDGTIRGLPSDFSCFVGLTHNGPVLGNLACKEKTPSALTIFSTNVPCGPKWATNGLTLLKNGQGYNILFGCKKRMTN